MGREDREVYPGASAHLIERLPRFVRRVLLAGGRDERLPGALQARGIDEVHAIDLHDAYGATPFVTARVSAVPGALGAEELGLPTGYYDALLLPDPAALAGDLAQVLRALLPSLKPDGYALFAAANPTYWRASAAHPLDVRASIEAAGLGVYWETPLWDPDYGAAQPDDQGRLCIAGRALPCATPEERRALLAAGFVLAAVRPTYNPVQHARDLLDDGRADPAYDILMSIPEVYHHNPRTQAVIFADTMMALLALERQQHDGLSLMRFTAALQYFYQVVAVEPLMHFAYQVQAEFWHLLGNDDMASRLLRSIAVVAPDEATLAQLTRYRPAAYAPRVLTPPEWQPPERPPRILFLLHPRPHYGMDVLFDGLCEVVGDENVVDFPWKPFLHGCQQEDYASYPCTASRRGAALEESDVTRQLREGRFDLILMGDFEEGSQPDVTKRLLDAGRDLPVFIVDATDLCHDVRGEIMAKFGMTRVAGYFKREMLKTADYGPNTFPIPFAYSDRRVAPDISGDRSDDFFWAGHREFGLRRLYLEHLEKTYGRSLDERVPQEEYVSKLLRARIGINIFGKGFDTVRYWELPAHGCMLLSERLPIHIPHDFVPDESAVFFSDLAELEDRLAYGIEHRDESLAIARAGYEHLKRHHTASARARQVLGWIQHALAGGPGS